MSCNVMFGGRPSQCIYRMIQGFLTHGNDPWYFIVHGICPWFFTHSHFRWFWSFLERVGINYNKCSASLHFFGKELIMFWAIFGGILVVKVKMEGIMVGL